MTAPPLSLMLFAAGLGTRMGALTRDRPKPLVEVAGRPLLDHALALADAAGIVRRVANVHWCAAAMTAALEARGVAVSPEPKLLDTGGGLRQALALLGPGPMATLNADAAWTGPNPLTALRRAWDGGTMDALLCLVPVSGAIGHAGAGDFDMAPDGRLTRGTGWVYTGAQIIAPGPVAGGPTGAFSLNLIWDRIAATGRLYGIPHRGSWCDVGSPGGITAAGAMLAGADVRV